MSVSAQNYSSPLAIIALFAAMIEASAVVSLPYLSDETRSIYIWLLVGFPPFLTLLFFITLNFNNKVLYAPKDDAVPAGIDTGFPSAHLVHCHTGTVSLIDLHPYTADEACSIPHDTLLQSLRAPEALMGDRTHLVLYVGHGPCSERLRVYLGMARRLPPLDGLSRGGLGYLDTTSGALSPL